MIYAVTQPTKRPRDEEECRLFGAYEASSAKEHTAASKLLNLHRELSRRAPVCCTNLNESFRLSFVVRFQRG
jgi:hypothetical protein